MSIRDWEEIYRSLIDEMARAIHDGNISAEGLTALAISAKEIREGIKAGLLPVEDKFASKFVTMLQTLKNAGDQCVRDAAEVMEQAEADVASGKLKIVRDPE